MSIVKVIELIGESPHGWEDAMREVIAEAQKTLRGITRIGVKNLMYACGTIKSTSFEYVLRCHFALNGSP